jgi:uncharacterized Tic20 family protein
MRETLSTLSLILGFVFFIAAIALPLIVWRIKDLLLEVRDEVRAVRKALQEPSIPRQ